MQQRGAGGVPARTACHFIQTRAMRLSGRTLRGEGRRGRAFLHRHVAGERAPEYRVQTFGFRVARCGVRRGGCGVRGEGCPSQQVQGSSTAHPSQV